jgi:pimeloyl-ACP methyl ester carboxylesterase
MMEEQRAGRLALIPSPFVGGLSWAAVAAVLGQRAVVASYNGVRAPDWHAGAAAQIVDQMDSAPWIAVLHSGGGAFAPVLADTAKRLAGFVFVDAGLPSRGLSSLEVAPPEFIARLRERTTDAVLAPWNAWFDVDPTVRMIPDPASRAAFIADQPSVPFAFLEAACPGSAAWEGSPCAYLQLSRAYADDARTAAERGWPVECIEAHHLAMASDPALTAAAIERFAARLPIA